MEGRITRLIDGEKILIAYNERKEIMCWGYNFNHVKLYLSKVGLLEKCGFIESDEPKFIHAVETTFFDYEILSGRDESDKLIVLRRKEYRYLVSLHYEMKSKIYSVIDNCRELVNTLEFSDKEYEKIRRMTIMLLKKSTNVNELSTLPKGVLNDIKSLRRAVEMEDELYNYRDSSDLGILCSQYCVILI